jgi:hypothetical protein
MNEKLVLSTLSGLLSVCREYEIRVSRLEIALETLLATPAEKWEVTAEAVRASLKAYDADSSTPRATQATDAAIESILRELSARGKA